jgi:hypothetical protein
MSDADFARLIRDVIRTAQRFEEIDAREKGHAVSHGVTTVQETETRSGDSPPDPRTVPPRVYPPRWLHESGRVGPQGSRVETILETIGR